MKRIIFFVLICLLLVSCASTKSPYQTADEIVAERTETVRIKGKYGVLRPNWITVDFTNEEIIFGVGYAKVNNEDDARKLAKIEAKNEITEKILTLVEETVETSKTKTGDKYEITSTQISRAYLSGAVVEDEWVSKDGTVYVLMSIPVSYVEAQMAMNLEVNNYIKSNDEMSLWDTLKGKLQDK